MSRLEQAQESLCKAYCALFDACEHIEDVLCLSANELSTQIDREKLAAMLDELEEYRQVIHTSREQLFLKTE